MKRFLSRGSNKGDHRKDPKPATDGAKGKDRRHQKLTHREVYTVEPAAPSFLRWLESAITFDRTDHPKSVPQSGRYLLMVDLIIGMKWLTKVLMDGGSGLNIMNAETLNALGIDRARVRPTGAPFHGIVPGKQAVPLRQIDLPNTFGDPTNYKIEIVAEPPKL